MKRFLYNACTGILFTGLLVGVVYCFAMAVQVAQLNDRIAAAAAVSEEFVQPEKILQEQGAPEDIRIIYTNDVELNCGYAKAVQSNPERESHHGGCYRPLSPDVLYLSENLEEVRPSAVKYLTLHEYAHYIQYHSNQELDECAADQLAADMGAKLQHSSYDCDIEQETLHKQRSDVKIVTEK